MPLLFFHLNVDLFLSRYIIIIVGTIIRFVYQRRVRFGEKVGFFLYFLRHSNSTIAGFNLFGGVYFFFANDKNDGISNELEPRLCFVARLLGKQRESRSQLSPSSVDADKQRNVTMADKHRSAAAHCGVRTTETHTHTHGTFLDNQNVRHNAIRAHKSVLGQRAAPFTHPASNLSARLGFQSQT